MGDFFVGRSLPSFPYKSREVDELAEISAGGGPGGVGVNGSTTPCLLTIG